MLRKYKRIVAAFLLLNFLSSVVTPTISWALTAGPTAPEATSFEPVDTTDMVNLLTGDLAYNIPLLEVPGPSGGYPLSLSYHAGIQPNEEASWLGLGWTLNPGAITRNVNGFPDDHFNVTNTDRFFWEGGERSTLKVGLTMGVSGLGGASAGLSISQDTYQGTSVGTFARLSFGADLGGATTNLGAQLEMESGQGIQATVGLTNSYVKILNVGVTTTNFKTVHGYASASVNLGFNSRLGATISTQNRGINFSGSVGGTSGIHNSKMGNVSVSSFGITLPVPLIFLGYNYQRYWIDETEEVQTYGALYNPTEVVTSGFDTNSYDSYSLLDPFYGIADNPDPDKVLGGSFLNFDQYNVTAQGLGGTMRPYSYRNLIFRQNRKKSGYDVKQYPFETGFVQDALAFRFVGDFSNRYIHENSVLTEGGDSQGTIPLFPAWSSSMTGEYGQDGILHGHLAGSRHIDWYTNDQILGLDNSKNPKGDGFIDARASGFVRSNQGSLGNQIGGFKIINESGVTYHYALPAYVYDEYQYSENINHDSGHTFNELKKKEPYAYTWFLTAITGPDFVDRGPDDGTPDGVLDEHDWGYWVEFEYGLWTKNYIWRNPALDFNKDLDNNFQNFSAGRKEIYYLDAVRTRTHTALFIKDLREDGKGIAVPDKQLLKSEATYDVDGNLGFVPKEIDVSFEYGYQFLKNGGNGSPEDHEFVLNPPYPENPHIGKVACVKHFMGRFKPVSLLRLKEIKLFNNSDLKALTPSSSDLKNRNETWNHANEFEFISAEPNNSVLINTNICEYDGQPNHYLASLGTEYFFDGELHLGSNVLTVNNVAGLDIDAIQLRAMKFDSDYTLCPEVENSYTNQNLYENYQELDRESSGKLTLNALYFSGKGGDIGLIPPMRFEYELDEPIKGIGNIVHSGELVLLIQNSLLQEGDIIHLDSGGGSYALIESINYDSGEHLLKILGANLPNAGMVAYKQTKNPPYQRNSYDMWGFYKSDSDEAEDDESKRIVTELSSRNIDVWSLRSVKTSTGAFIRFAYGSDQYENAIQLNGSLTINEIIPVQNPDLIDISFNSQLDLTKLNLQIGDTVRMIGSIRYWSNGAVPNSTMCVSDGDYVVNMFKWDPMDHQGVIEQVNRNSIRIRSSSLLSQLTFIYNTIHISCTNTNNIGQQFDPEYVFPNVGIFLGGNVVFSKPISLYGGGVRVEGVSIETMSKKLSTIYTYANGVTPYEPRNLELFSLNLIDFVYSINDKRQEEGLKDFKRLLYGNFSELLGVSRELPPPGVIYEFVTVQEKQDDVELPSKMLYEFEVFNKENIGIIERSSENVEFPSDRTYNDVTYKRLKKRDLAIKDLTATVGAVKRITVIDDQGSKLSETVNHYLHDDIEGQNLLEKSNNYHTNLLEFKSQGVVQETLMDGRFVKEDDGTFSLFGIVSRKHHYPLVHLGRTTINYKTGISQTNHNLAFDFYSGHVVKSQTSDGYGNTYVTESTPAYQIHKFASMGPAILGGKNMLIQESLNKTYKVNPTNNDKIGLVAASVQTWSDQIPTLDGVQAGVWRKHATYSWVGDDIAVLDDGLYPYSAFSEFNFDDVTSNQPKWQMLTEATLYDSHSHLLEVVDMNQNFIGTKMSVDESHVYSTVANARYHEFAYSGAEDEMPNSFTLGGNVIYAGSVVNTAHTGTKAISAGINVKAFSYSFDPEPRIYHVSVWSSKPPAEATIMYKLGAGSDQDLTISSVRRAGNWYLLEADIPLSTDHESLEIWCASTAGTAIFDDFRVHPLDAAMTSYVYNEWGELTHILDNNNLYTEYRYDAMGRLQETFKETLMKESGTQYGNNGIVRTGEVKYHYKGQN